ncbi:MAG: ParB N-terminal domain-containing protein [Phenylobacterium sp.]|uniref:ParB N-terminal domain-containing protein n=1 Tax=Phenylobacterium sp. TaxID=1871053 RepID=UPI003BB6BF2A
MNAHTPVEGERTGGRPALDRQVLAVQQADLLRYIADPDDPEAFGALEPGEIARALGRDPSNLRKTLQVLERGGLVTSKPVALTPAAIDLIPRLAILAGDVPLQAGLPPLTYEQIREDENNPREIFDPKELALLAESIARRGLKQPILVRLDADGQGATLNDGARRYRAIGKLIAAADPRWPADRPIPYHLTAATDEGEILADAVITSLQRVDLHPIDEGNAFAKLKTFGWTTGRILDEIGCDRRYLEQRLDLLNLTEAQQARMRLDPDDDNYLSISGARKMLQHLRKIGQNAEQLDLETRTLDLSAKEQLALVETAWAVDHAPGKVWAPVSEDIAGGALSTLIGRALIEVKPGAAGFRATMIRVLRDTTAAGPWLAGNGYLDDPKALLFRVRETVLGRDKAVRLADEKRYATSELNPDPDPLVVNGQRFPNSTHAEEARRLLAGGGPSNSGGGSAKREEPATHILLGGARPAAMAAAEEPDPFAALTPRHRLIVLELAHKILAQLSGDTAPVGKYWLDGRLDALVQEHKLISFHNPGGRSPWRGLVTPTGWNFLREYQPLTFAALHKARQEAGQGAFTGPGYVTAWLNLDGEVDTSAEIPPAGGPADAAAATPAAIPDAVPDEAEEADDNAEAEALLDRIVSTLAAGNALRPDAGDEHFSALLQAAGWTGPFVHSEDEMDTGSVYDANGQEAFVVDVNRELPDAKVRARAILIAWALNHIAPGDGQLGAS